MSRLFIVTRPTLAPGFQLAGVEAFAVHDAAEGEKLIGKWLDAGETGLLAVDAELLAALGTSFRQRLDRNSKLLYLPLPAGDESAAAASSQERIAELLRQAIGFHISFT